MIYDPYVHHMFGWGFGGGFMMLLLWAGIILLLVWVVRGFRRGESGTHDQARTNNKALDILKERYAKGDIEKEEYEAKRKDLE